MSEEVTKQATTVWLCRLRLVGSGTVFPVAPCPPFPKCKSNTAQAVPAGGAAFLLLTSSFEQLPTLAELFFLCPSCLADLHLFHHRPTESIQVFM